MSFNEDLDIYTRSMYTISLYVYIHTLEYYIFVRNDAILQFHATWMELEETMLKEVS